MLGPKQVDEQTTKKAKRVKSQAPAQKADPPTEADISWIPEHHLKLEAEQSKPVKRKASKKKKS